MNSFAFTVDVPAEYASELRELINQVAAHPAGLIGRARDIGYHREHMWIDNRTDGTVRLVVNIDAPDHLSWDMITSRLSEYSSDFSHSWNPRFGHIVAASLAGGRPTVRQAAFSWDDVAPQQRSSPKAAAAVGSTKPS